MKNYPEISWLKQQRFVTLLASLKIGRSSTDESWVQLCGFSSNSVQVNGMPGAALLQAVGTRMVPFHVSLILLGPKHHMEYVVLMGMAEM